MLQYYKCQILGDSMKASDYIVSFLAAKDIPYVFGYIGGMVAHLVDSLYKSDKVQMVNAIQEQGAGFAADGYARTTPSLCSYYNNQSMYMQVS